jgi:hypothetical protein
LNWFAGGRLSAFFFVITRGQRLGAVLLTADLTALFLSQLPKS